MLPSFDSSRRIKLPVGDDYVTLIVREPSAKEVSNFLTSRFRQKGRKIDSSGHAEARAKFTKSILVDIENAGYRAADGEMRPLNKSTSLSDQDKAFAAGFLGHPVEDWRDLVNFTWLASAAMLFEESTQDEGGNEGN